MGLTLSGSGQHLDFGSAIVTAPPFSFSCWVNFATVPTSTQIVMSASSTVTSVWDFALYISSTGKLVAYQNNNSTTGLATSAASITANTWYHCVAVFTSNASRTCYLNGTGVTNTTNVGTPTGTPNQTSIGCQYLGTATANALMAGSIAFPTIWKVALSSTDDTNLYNGGSGGYSWTIETPSCVSYLSLSSAFPSLDSLSYNSGIQYFGAEWTTTGSPTNIADPFSLPWTLVQEADGAQTSGTTQGITQAANPTTGDLLVVAATVVGNVASSLAVSDTLTTSYSKAVGGYDSGTGVTSAIWYGICSNPGDSSNAIGISWTGTEFSMLQVWEFYCSSGAPSLDKATSAPGSGTSASSGTVSTSSANELLFGWVVPANSISAGETGWPTVIDANTGIAGEFTAVTATGSYAATATVSGGGAWVAYIATFQHASGIVSLSVSMASVSSSALKVIAVLKDTFAAKDGMTATDAHLSKKLLSDTLAGKAGITATDSHLSKSILTDALAGKGGITTTDAHLSKKLISDTIAVKGAMTEKVVVLLKDGVAGKGGMTTLNLSTASFVLLQEAFAAKASFKPQLVAALSDAISAKGSMADKLVAALRETFATKTTAAAHALVYKFFPGLSISSNAGMTELEMAGGQSIWTIVDSDPTNGSQVQYYVQPAAAAISAPAVWSAAHDTVSQIVTFFAATLPSPIFATMGAFAGMTSARVRALLKDRLSAKGSFASKITAALSDTIATFEGITHTGHLPHVLLNDAMAVEASVSPFMVFNIGSDTMATKSTLTVSFGSALYVSFGDTAGMTTVRAFAAMHDKLATKTTLPTLNLKGSTNFHIAVHTTGGITRIVSAPTLSVSISELAGMTKTDSHLSKVLLSDAVRALAGVTSAPNVALLEDTLSSRASVFAPMSTNLQDAMSTRTHMHEQITWAIQGAFSVLAESELTITIIPGGPTILGSLALAVEASMVAENVVALSESFGIRAGVHLSMVAALYDRFGAKISTSIGSFVFPVAEHLASIAGITRTDATTAISVHLANAAGLTEAAFKYPFYDHMSAVAGIHSRIYVIIYDDLSSKSGMTTANLGALLSDHMSLEAGMTRTGAASMFSVHVLSSAGATELPLVRLKLLFGTMAAKSGMTARAYASLSDQLRAASGMTHSQVAALLSELFAIHAGLFPNANPIAAAIYSVVILDTEPLSLKVGTTYGGNLTVIVPDKPMSFYTTT